MFCVQHPLVLPCLDFRLVQRCLAFYIYPWLFAIDSLGALSDASSTFPALSVVSGPPLPSSAYTEVASHAGFCRPVRHHAVLCTPRSLHMCSHLCLLISFPSQCIWFRCEWPAVRRQEGIIILGEYGLLQRAVSCSLCTRPNSDGYLETRSIRALCI